jgi:hypothetical protein
MLNNMNVMEVCQLDISISGLGLNAMWWFYFISNKANVFTEVDIEMRWPFVLIISTALVMFLSRLC